MFLLNLLLIASNNQITTPFSNPADPITPARQTLLALVKLKAATFSLRTHPGWFPAPSLPLLIFRANYKPKLFPPKMSEVRISKVKKKKSLKECIEIKRTTEDQGKTLLYLDSETRK